MASLPTGRNERAYNELQAQQQREQAARLSIVLRSLLSNVAGLTSSNIASVMQQAIAHESPTQQRAILSALNIAHTHIQRAIADNESPTNPTSKQ